MPHWIAALAATWTLRLLPFTLVTGETDRKPLPATTPGGIAILDFDRDGLLDLYFPNGGALPTGPKAPNRLLRNKGGLEFEDITTRARATGSQYDIAAIAADYDGDGYTDIALMGLHGVTLLRNRAGTEFEDVTRTSGLDNLGRWAVGGAWLDFDGDGDLDLFVVNYVAWDPAAERPCLVNGKPDFCHPRHYAPLPNALFRNDSGRFVDISEASGIAASKGKGMAAAVARSSIFVTNDRAFAFLFQPAGPRFEERAFDVGVAVPSDGNPVSGMGADAQDYNNDGRPDLVYSALRDETFPLYRATADGFEETTASSGLATLTRPMAGWGIVFADLDNDGWKDIAAARSDALSATGGKAAQAKEPPAWFRNAGASGKFAAGQGWTAAPRAMYRGIAAADLDNDGCLDIVLTALSEPARILRNPCPPGPRWIKVQAPGSVARVRVGSQWREASTSAGYASSNAGPLHFGLGTADSAEVEVFWTNGQSRRQTVPAGRLVNVAP